MRPSFSRRTFLASLIAPSLALMFQDDSGRIKRWLQGIYNTDPPLTPAMKPQPELWSDHTITAAWIGHSTVIVNFFGTMIITDPVFSDRVGPKIAGLFTLGPKRIVQPALAFNDLPGVDLILISHAHMDHCDIPSLERFPRSTPIIIPRNTIGAIEDLGFESIYELDWRQWTSLGGLRVEGLEARHKGSRYPWGDADSREAEKSNGYLVTKNGARMVYAGDTGFHEKFKTIPDREKGVTLAIVPIGGYIPHHHNHCNPEEALMMTNQMDAQFILPVHWGTFPGEEGYSEPIDRLKEALAGEQNRLAVDQIGQTWTLPVGE